MAVTRRSVIVAFSDTFSGPSAALATCVAVPLNPTSQPVAWTVKITLAVGDAAVGHGLERDPPDVAFL